MPKPHYARKHPYEGTWDAHPTPPEWTRVLIREIPTINMYNIWEPACGDGRMSQELKRAGCRVLSTDITDHGYGRYRSWDFTRQSLPKGYNAIVTNPPYKLAGEFVRHAINLPGVALVAMLLKADFGNAIGRLDLTMGKQRPFHIWNVVDRMPGEFGKGGKYTFCHAWWLWLPEMVSSYKVIDTVIDYVRADGKENHA